MNLEKDPESWARVDPAAVLAGSPTQAFNVLGMAIRDIQKMSAEITALQLREAGERNGREKLATALRQKDEAMGVLFERLDKAGVDYRDLLS